MLSQTMHVHHTQVGGIRIFYYLGAYQAIKALNGLAYQCVFVT